LIELFGFRKANRSVDRVIARNVEVFDELVQEQPPKAFMGSAISGKQRPFDYFRQINQRKNGLVQVGEVPTKDVFFGRRKLFDGVVSQCESQTSEHGQTDYSVRTDRRSHRGLRRAPSRPLIVSKLLKVRLAAPATTNADIDLPRHRQL